MVENADAPDSDPGTATSSGLSRESKGRRSWVDWLSIFANASQVVDGRPFAFLVRIVSSVLVATAVVGGGVAGIKYLGRGDGTVIAQWPDGSPPPNPAGPAQRDTGQSTTTAVGGSVVSELGGEASGIGAGGETGDSQATPSVTPDPGGGPESGGNVDGATVTAASATTTTTTPTTTTSEQPPVVSESPPSALATGSWGSAGEVDALARSVESLCSTSSSADNGKTVKVAGHSYYIYWVAGEHNAAKMSSGRYLVSVSAGDVPSTPATILAIGDSEPEAISADLPGLAMCGGGGDDLLIGKIGSNLVVGGAGSDTLKGGLGSDLLVGELGDTLNGDPSGSADEDWCTVFQGAVPRPRSEGTPPPGIDSTCEYVW